MTMKVEALTIFSTFSSPIHSARNVLKDHSGKPVIQDVPERKASDLLEAQQTVKKSNFLEVEQAGCGVQQFTPYPAKLPWHTGSKGALSRLFPRYGNYCGPNWSSGRESGSLMWDKAPIDALDFCCYKHDMGYDSYEQADLHQADLVFLNCLERMPHESIKGGDSPLSEPYRNIYIFGLRNVMIPYRKFVLQNVNEKTRKRLTEEEIFGKDRSRQ
ncbi:unnamed protein product [Calypogeia fissa]